MLSSEIALIIDAHKADASFRPAKMIASQAVRMRSVARRNWRRWGGEFVGTDELDIGKSAPVVWPLMF
jgi:hypothetical protein